MEMEWPENYFGKGTRSFTAYLDAKDRVFLIPQADFELAEEHNCDSMGCGSVGPHIIGVYLNATLVNAIRTENARYKTALERLARLGNEPELGNSLGNRIAQQALKG